MGDVWDFNCPQFVDFNGPVDEEDNADEWFDMQHETSDVYYTPVVDRKSRGEPKRVLSEVVLSTNNIRQEYSGGRTNAKRKPSTGPLRVPSTKDENNPPETRAGDSKASLSSRVSKYSSKPRRSCVEVSAGESVPVKNCQMERLKIKSEVLGLPAAAGGTSVHSGKIAKYTPRRSKYKEVGAGEAGLSREEETLHQSQNSTKESPLSNGDEAVSVDDGNASISSSIFTGRVMENKGSSSTPNTRAMRKRKSWGKNTAVPAKRSSLSKRRSLSKASSFTNALRRSPRMLLEKLTGGTRSKPTTPVTGVSSADNSSTKSERLRRSWNKPSSNEKSKLKPAASRSPNLGKLKKLEPEHNAAFDVRKQLALRRKMAAPAVKAVVPMKAVAASNPVKPCSTQAEYVQGFASTLRKFNEEPVNALPKPSITRPMPFKLSQPKKRKHEEQGGEFHSMAEQIIAFQSKTPLRFRTRSKNASCSLPSSPEGPKSPKLVTIPQTPKLMSRYRTRPITALSRVEIETQEFEENKKNQFKAHPVNLKAIQQPQLKEVKSKTPTKPEPFKLTYTQRQPGSLHNTPTEKYEFRARPVPPGLFDGPKGVVSRKESSATLPQTSHSPPLLWKGRLRRRSKSFSDKSEYARPKVLKANPVPHPGVPFKIKLDKKTTLVEPFSFDELDRKRMVQKEEKLKELIEQETKVREFHAQPLPNLEPCGIPEKHPRPPTEIQPFHFAYEESAACRVEKWKREIEEEQRRQRELALFKAGPNKVIYEEPFIPEKSSKPLTVIANIELNTERRAQNREEFDEYLKYKESEMEALRMQREAEAEEREREYIAKLREDSVHRAKPVRNYKPVTIQPSQLPLTVPQSPCFSNKTN